MKTIKKIPTPRSSENNSLYYRFFSLKRSTFLSIQTEARRPYFFLRSKFLWILISVNKSIRHGEQQLIAMQFDLQRLMAGGCCFVCRLFGSISSELSCLQFMPLSVSVVWVGEFGSVDFFLFLCAKKKSFGYIQ